MTDGIEVRARRLLAGLEGDPLAEAALKLARELDGYVPAKELPALHREFRIAMAELRAKAPAPTGDVVDEIAKKRKTRKGA